LDNIDFLDFTIYNINDKRNFKNIYFYLFHKHSFNDENYLYKMNDRMLQLYIDSYYFNLFDQKKDFMYYNFLYKAEEKHKIKDKFYKVFFNKYNKK
jgi:hypothetical protein